MTAGLLVSRRQKNKLFKKQIAHPTNDNVNHFRIYRNIYNSTLRKSKKLFYESTISKFKSKPKQLWEFLRSVNGNIQCSNNINEVIVDQNVIKDDKKNCASFQRPLFKNRFNNQRLYC
jgi:hypothetical protein